MTTDFAAWFRALPCALPATGVSGVYRQSNADFLVEEELGFDLTGDGEHWWLFIETDGLTTPQTAERLGRANNIPIRDIGYSGLKDRHAVTRQWFSLPAAKLKQADVVFPESKDWQLIDKRRHTRKLKRGSHDKNNFELTLRDIVGDYEFLRSRVAELRASGIPNYFGEQRFGRGYSNLERAAAWTRGSKLKRNQRGYIYSASRSAIFNSVLGARIDQSNWNQLIDGDRPNLNGTGSHFSMDAPTIQLQERCVSGDIHPTATLWGDGGSRLTVLAKELECREVADSWSELGAALERARLNTDLRALRVLPEALEVDRSDSGVRLSFSLRKGAYATALLRELGQFREFNRDQA